MVEKIVDRNEHLVNKARILLVTNGFLPEISPRSFRATELAKEFCRLGHKVTVISKYRDYDYSAFIKEFPIILKMWGEPKFPKVPEMKGPISSRMSTALSRILSVFFEYPGIEEMFSVKRILKNENGYDLLISFAVPYPVHWGVAKARSRKHQIAEIWIADCGDPYMFARLDTFKKPFYFMFLERSFCRKCDYIAVPFKEMKTQFYYEFRQKIKVIPQGINFDEVRLYAGQPYNQKPVFMFAGSVIPGKRDLSLLLDFLGSLKMDFLFVIYTNQSWWFEKYRLAMGDRLEIRGYIQRLSLIYEMSKADFLINVDTNLDSQSNIEAVPSKLIDYVLTGRPILNINSSFLDEDLVMEFLQKNYSRQRVVEKSIYDIKRVTAQILEIIRK